MTLKGRVKALRGPDEHLYDRYGKGGKVTGTEKEVYPGCMEVEISSMEVEGKSEFDPGEEDD